MGVCGCSVTGWECSCMADLCWAVRLPHNTAPCMHAQCLPQLTEATGPHIHSRMLGAVQAWKAALTASSKLSSCLFGGRWLRGQGRQIGSQPSQQLSVSHWISVCAVFSALLPPALQFLATNTISCRCRQHTSIVRPSTPSPRRRLLSAVLKAERSCALLGTRVGGVSGPREARHD